MDEYLNPVDAGSVEVVSPQETVETDVTVNAENAEVANGEQEQTVEGSKQTDAELSEKPQETHEQSKEENALFAKVRKEAEAKTRAEFEQRQAAKDAEFAQLAVQNGWVDGSGNPIKTEDAYWTAVKAQAKIDALVNSGKTPQEARLEIERDEWRDKMSALDAKYAAEAKANAEFNEFAEYFHEANGRDFTVSDVIPPEVFVIAHENGLPLRFAYSDYLAKAAIAEKKNLALGKQTAEVNNKNATTSTGSVTGSPQSDSVTAAEINAHSDDVAWMNKNFKKVEEYYRKKG